MREEAMHIALEARRAGDLAAWRMLIPKPAEEKAENQVHLQGASLHETCRAGPTSK